MGIASWIKNKSAKICIGICENLREILHHSKQFQSKGEFSRRFSQIFFAQINADKKFKV
jgi:hypothetical protein